MAHLAWREQSFPRETVWLLASCTKGAARARLWIQPAGDPCGSVRFGRGAPHHDKRVRTLVPHPLPFPQMMSGRYALGRVRACLNVPTFAERLHPDLSIVCRYLRTLGVVVL